MGAPYEKTVQFAAESGRANHVAIPFLHRGQVTRILVKQTDGVLAGYRFNLYNSKRPMDDDSQSSQSAAAPATDHLAFQIIPTQNIAGSGDVLEMYTETGTGYEFRNVDGSYSVPERFLYVRVEPHGTGSKNFQVTLVGVPAL